MSLHHLQTPAPRCLLTLKENTKSMGSIFILCANFVFKKPHRIVLSAPPQQNVTTRWNHGCNMPPGNGRSPL